MNLWNKAATAAVAFLSMGLAPASAAEQIDLDALMNMLKRPAQAPVKREAPKLAPPPEVAAEPAAPAPVEQLANVSSPSTPTWRFPETDRELALYAISLGLERPMSIAELRGRICAVLATSKRPAPTVCADNKKR